MARSGTHILGLLAKSRLSAVYPRQGWKQASTHEGALTRRFSVLRHGEANRSGDHCEEMLVCYTPRSQEEGARHATQGRTALGSARMEQEAERARAKHG